MGYSEENITSGICFDSDSSMLSKLIEDVRGGQGMIYSEDRETSGMNEILASRAPQEATPGSQSEHRLNILFTATQLAGNELINKFTGAHKPLN